MQLGYFSRFQLGLHIEELCPEDHHLVREGHDLRLQARPQYFVL
jgi:hypothetical protein